MKLSQNLEISGGHPVCVLRNSLALALVFALPLFVPAGTAQAQALELAITDHFSQTWNDVASGGAYDGSFWEPLVPGGSAFQVLGHVAASNYNQPSSTVVARAIDPTALAHPTGFVGIWRDTGSGANLDGCFYQPIPPAGYTCLGTVSTNCATGPFTTAVSCVRSDLVVPASVGRDIYDDTGSGANSDFSAWQVVAPAGAIDIGSFVGVSGYSPPTNVYALRADAVATPPAPTPAELEYMLYQYGPIIRFDPSESYFPDDPAVILDRPDTTLQWGTVQNESDYNTFVYTPIAAIYTSSSTILSDVQVPLSQPQAANADFRYNLNFPKFLPGDPTLARAKAYVRVQPYQQVMTELQFWYFAPWNSAGKSHLSCGALEEDFDPTGPVGEHWSDWENVRVRVSTKNVWSPGTPAMVSVVLSRHASDEEVAAADPRLVITAGSPIVYAGRGSHAHYPDSGRHYYATVGTTNLGFCTATVQTYDETGSGAAFNTYAAQNRIVVSSAWPSVATTTPDWFFFGGQWGNWEKQQFCVTAFGSNIQCANEVDHGKPGLIRRAEWDVPVPVNYNLGTLRFSAGKLSPAFDPNITSYTLLVDSSVTSLSVTTQGSDYHDFLQVYNTNTSVASYPGMGLLLGKAAPPLAFASGQEIGVFAFKPDFTANRAYSVRTADNCSSVTNTDQRDTNGDGYGNLCDPDFDNNGTVNINDFNRLKARLGISPVVDVDTDLDGNAAVNINDLNRLKSFLGKPPGPSNLHPNCPPTCP